MEGFCEYNGILAVEAGWMINNNIISEPNYKSARYRKNFHVIRRSSRNTPALVHYNNLPNRYKQSIIDHLGEDPLAAFLSRDRLTKLVDQRISQGKAMDAHRFFFTDYHKPDGTYLTQDKAQEYYHNAIILDAITDLLQDIKNRCITTHTRFNASREFETIALSLSEGLSLEYRNSLPQSVRLQTKYKEYKTKGYSCLIHKHLGKQSNATKVTDKVLALLESLFAHQFQKPTFREVASQYEAFLHGQVHVINNVTGEQYNPADFIMISETTVKTYLNKWESRIATHQIRKNDRQKSIANFNPHHSMTLPKYAGSLISVDDRQPPFEYESGKRLWFYNGQDVASGCITTWVWGKDKQGIILDFYRQMVRNYHEWGVQIPMEIECESNLNAQYKDTFLKEGSMFKYVRMEANNARGKYIEAGANNGLRYQLEKQYEGWKARPFARKESNRSDGQSNLKPYDYIKQISLKAIEQWNNSPCPQDETMSRFDYFLKNQNPNMTPTNYKEIIRQLGYQTQTSCRVARVALNNTKLLLGRDGHISKGDELVTIMKHIEGENLTAYWLDDNDGNVLKAYAYLGDTCVCELLPEPKYSRARAEQTEQDLQNRSLMSAYQMTVVGFGNTKKKSIDKVTVIDERTKTLNNNFQIPELHQDDDFALKANSDTAGEVEILPDPTLLQEDCNAVATSIKSNNWKDNF